MKKISPYILIFVILVGLFGPVAQVLAQAGTPTADPIVDCDVGGDAPVKMLKSECDKVHAGTPATPPAKVSFSAENLEHCGGPLSSGTLTGCLVQGAYYLFYALPSAILYLSADLFDSLLSVTLSSALYTKSNFIPEAWKIVRDFSNIFFILVLLYIAIKMILGFGGAEVKKMVVNVVIVALLINFSMFFTQVVVDSSNILALIFYNKITISYKNPGPNQIPPTAFEPTFDQKKTGMEQKGLAGMIVQSFDPASFIDLSKFGFKNPKISINWLNAVISSGSGGNPIATTVNSIDIQSAQIPTSLALSIIFVAGAIFLFAAYAFFIAGLAFLGRLIELWLLIIFSPFAFLSFTVPKLKNVDWLGWDSWLKRLLTVGFMAPLFMFFMLIIAQFVKADIFGGLINDSTSPSGISSLLNAKTLLSIIIPAIIVIIMLHRATAFAKKGSGEFGEAVIKGGTAIAGLAGALVVGGGIGLAAKTLQGGAGHAGKAIFENKKLADWETTGNWAQRKFASRVRTIGGGDDGKGGLAGSSFDLRKGVAGGALKAFHGATGINLGHDSKLWAEGGGYEADLNRRDQKRKKRAEGLKAKEGEPEKQALNKAEEEKQALQLKYEERLKELERLIPLKRQALNDANARFGAKTPEADAAGAVLQELIDEKSKIKNANIATRDPETGEITGYNTHNGSITEKHFETINKANIDSASAEEAARIAKEGAEEAARIAKEGAEEAARKLTKAVADRAELERRAEEDPANIILVKAAREEEIAAREASSKAEANAKTKKDFMDSGAEEAYERAKANRQKAADALDSGRKLLDLYGGFGNSINDYEDKIIPHLKHEVEHVSKERQRGYANALEKQWFPFFGNAARKKSAHDIRMGAAPEKSSGGGGGGHFGTELAAGLLSEAVGGKIFGEGGHKGGGGPKK